MQQFNHNESNTSYSMLKAVQLIMQYFKTQNGAVNTPSLQVASAPPTSHRLMVI